MLRRVVVLFVAGGLAFGGIPHAHAGTASGIAVSRESATTLIIHAFVEDGTAILIRDAHRVVLTSDCVRIYPGFETGPFVYASGTGSDDVEYYVFVGDEWLEHYGPDQLGVATVPDVDAPCGAGPPFEHAVVQLFGIA